ELPDESARLPDRLRLNLPGYVEALDQAGEMNSARALYRVGDRFCGKERAPERLDGGDIGLGETCGYRDAYPAARVGADASRHDLALFREVLQRRSAENHDVCGFARVDAAHHDLAGIVARGDLVPGRPLEARRELGHDAALPVGGEYGDGGHVFTPICI